MRKYCIFLLVVAILISLPGCYRLRSSKGGGEISTVNQRTLNASDVALPPGYKIELVASGFTFPSAVAFDAQGQLHVIETGYSYGEVWGEPKLIRIDAQGKQTVVAKGARNGPWTGITFHNGSFYVAEGGQAEGGKILRISTTGEIKSIIDNLPSVGDHHTNGPVIRDGYVYFGQGTATNSAVVGGDNAQFGWLLRKPDFHDIPCADITLTGQNYESENVLTPDANDKATTGAYSAFGKSTTAGEVIKGALPCTGAVMRVPLEGGKPELVAWGFRNPFGLAFSADGKLYVTENGYDDRGSRPVWGTGDVLWEVRQGMWYGWPDFSAGKPIRSDEEFKVPSRSPVKPVLQNYPNTPPAPVAIFGVHSSSNGLDFSTNNSFGYQGQAFVAQFGDMSPGVGKVLRPVGFKIVRVDVSNGVIRDFAVNRGKRNGPASWLGHGGLERPVSVKFDPSGQVLYVVDFGIMKMTDKGPQPQTGTGVIWKITREGI
ncbi:MAG TPA: PQQ-dependent sugar dehydrogenase [Chitinophagaceae bacterium]|nr:PQQ-dependent sugar dehydrogenase [Chitinophagaceae bacterium]